MRSQARVTAHKNLTGQPKAETKLKTRGECEGQQSLFDTPAKK